MAYSFTPGIDSGDHALPARDGLETSDDDKEVGEVRIKRDEMFSLRTADRIDGANRFSGRLLSLRSCIARLP